LVGVHQRVLYDLACARGDARAKRRYYGGEGEGFYVLASLCPPKNG
jgi:hypothetical protein